MIFISNNMACSLRETADGREYIGLPAAACKDGRRTQQKCHEEVGESLSQTQKIQHSADSSAANPKSDWDTDSNQELDCGMDGEKTTRNYDTKKGQRT